MERNPFDSSNSGRILLGTSPAKELSSASLYESLVKAFPFFVFAGPRLLEDRNSSLYIAQELNKLAKIVELNLVFRTAFDKPFVKGIDKYRGPGIDDGLKTLHEIKSLTGLTLCVDVHECWQVDLVTKVADILEIPKQLFRQTDLIISAARTDKPVLLRLPDEFEAGELVGTLEKLKPGSSMRTVFVYSGNRNGQIDLARLQELSDLGYPVVADLGKICSRVTRGVKKDLLYYGARVSKDLKQKPLADTIESVSKALLQLGITGLAVNTHNDPTKSLCNQRSIMPLSKLAPLLEKLKKLKEIEKQLFS